MIKFSDQLSQDN